MYKQLLVILLINFLVLYQIAFYVPLSYAQDALSPAIEVYTLDNTQISPKVSIGVKDTASFDLKFSEEVKADFDILDSNGTKVKDIYNSSAVTNPQAKTWDGKDNTGNYVEDGVYTIKILITDKGNNSVIDTSKTITVNSTPLTLTAIGNKAVTKGSELTFTSEAVDEESGTLAFSLINAPTDAIINSSTGAFNWTPSESGSYSFTISVSSTTGSTASEEITVTVNDNSSTETAGKVTLVPSLTLDPTAPEVIIGSIPFDSNITIPDSVTNATLNVAAIINTVEEVDTATIVNNINITANTSAGNINVQIPSGINVSGSSASWDGIINIPTIQNNSTVTLPPSFGGASVNSVVEIGFGDVVLTFDKAVRIVLPGQASRSTGYTRGGLFTEITATCTTDSQAIADTLSAGADCKINSGSDLVIWTKHFTKFVTFTQPNNNSSSSNGGGSSGSSAGSNAASCTDSAAGGVPVLLSTSVSGANQVTLNWAKAADPVTHYVVVYGLTSNNPLYGNPSVGGKDTTSFTVNNLSGGTTYYFKVRAGNGCNAGGYSNEIAAAPGGSVVQSSAASGFTEGILGVSSEEEQENIGEVEGTSTSEGKLMPGSYSQSAEEVSSAMQKNRPWIVLIVLAGMGGAYYFSTKRH